MLYKTIVFNNQFLSEYGKNESIINYLNYKSVLNLTQYLSFTNHITLFIINELLILFRAITYTYKYMYSYFLY